MSNSKNLQNSDIFFKRTKFFQTNDSKTFNSIINEFPDYPDDSKNQNINTKTSINYQCNNFENQNQFNISSNQNINTKTCINYQCNNFENQNQFNISSNQKNYQNRNPPNIPLLLKNKMGDYNSDIHLTMKYQKKRDNPLNLNNQRVDIPLKNNNQKQPDIPLINQRVDIPLLANSRILNPHLRNKLNYKTDTYKEITNLNIKRGNDF